MFLNPNYRLVLDANNLVQEIIRLIKLHVPEVEVARQHGRELSLILPHHCVNKFAALFSELEYEITHGNRFKISSYGISMTTLEEVTYFEKYNHLIINFEILNSIFIIKILYLIRRYSYIWKKVTN